MHIEISKDTYNKTQSDLLWKLPPHEVGPSKIPSIGISIDNGFYPTEIYLAAGVLISKLEAGLITSQAHCLLFNASAKDRGNNPVFLELLIGVLHGALTNFLKHNKVGDITSYFDKAAGATITSAIAAIAMHYPEVADATHPDIANQQRNDFPMYQQWRQLMLETLYPSTAPLKLPEIGASDPSRFGGRPVGGFSGSVAKQSPAPSGPFILGNTPLFGFPVFYDFLNQKKEEGNSNVVEEWGASPESTNANYYRSSRADETVSSNSKKDSSWSKDQSYSFFAESDFGGKVNVGDELVLVKYSDWTVSAIDCKGILTVPPRPLFNESEANLYHVKDKETGVVRYVVIEKSKVYDDYVAATEESEEPVAELPEETTPDNELDEESFEEEDGSLNETQNSEEEVTDMADYDDNFDAEKIMQGKSIVAEPISDEEELRKELITAGKMADPEKSVESKKAKGTPKPPKTLNITSSSLMDSIQSNFKQAERENKRRVEQNKTGKVQYSFIDKLITGASIENIAGKMDIENVENGFPFLVSSSALWLYNRQDVVKEADVEEYVAFVPGFFEFKQGWAKDHIPYCRNRVWNKMFEVSHLLVKSVLTLEHGIPLNFDNFAEDWQDVLKAIGEHYEEEVFDMIVDRVADLVPSITFVRKRSLPDTGMDVTEFQIPIGVMNLSSEPYDRLASITQDNPVAQVSRINNPEFYGMLANHFEHVTLAAQRSNRPRPLFNIILENNRQYVVAESLVLDDSFLIAEASHLSPLRF